MLFGICGLQRHGRVPRWSANLASLACGFVGCLSVAPATAQGQPPQGQSPANLPVAASSSVPHRPFGADAAGDTPQTRLRPIGAPSAVDAIRAQPAAQPFAQPFAQPAPSGVPQSVQSPAFSPATSAGPSATAVFGGSAPVRQAAMMQAQDGSALTLPSLPPGGYAAPPTYSPPATTSPPMTPSAMPAPAVTGNPTLPPALGSSTTAGPINLPAPDLGTSPLPRGNTAPSAVAPLTPQIQPSRPAVATPAPQRGMVAAPTMVPGDYAPLPQPQLTTGFATLGNCRNVSAPSGYQSDRIPTYAPDPTSISQASATGYGGPATAPSAPTVLPPVSVMPLAQGTPGFTTAPTPVSLGVQTIVPGPAKHQPLISFGQERYPVQVGQGIFGQPVAYVPGQPIRNCIRYLCW